MGAFEPDKLNRTMNAVWDPGAFCGKARIDLGSQAGFCLRPGMTFGMCVCLILIRSAGGRVG